jgi:hypothetical protein
MIDQDNFAHQIAILRDLFIGGDYSQAFHLSHSLKHEILHYPPVKPEQLGLVRLYGFKSLFSLQKYDEAYEYLNKKEQHLFIMPANEAAELYLQAAEVIVRLNKPGKEIVHWGQKAFDLKIASNDLPGVVDVCNTVCTFLGILQEDTLNTKFAEWLIVTGVEFNADRLIIGGVAHLLRNAELSHKPNVYSILAQRRERIELAFSGPHGQEAQEIFQDYLHVFIEKKAS